MSALILLIAVGVLAAVGIAATVVAWARDGYRRTPTRYDLR